MVLPRVLIVDPIMPRGFGWINRFKNVIRRAQTGYL
jgi:hypothetical protein